MNIFTTSNKKTTNLSYHWPDLDQGFWSTTKTTTIFLGCDSIELNLVIKWYCKVLKRELLAETICCVLNLFDPIRGVLRTQIIEDCSVFLIRCFLIGWNMLTFLIRLVWLNFIFWDFCLGWTQIKPAQSGVAPKNGKPMIAFDPIFSLKCAVSKNQHPNTVYDPSFSMRIPCIL